MQKFLGHIFYFEHLFQLQNSPRTKSTGATRKPSARSRLLIFVFILESGPIAAQSGTRPAPPPLLDTPPLACRTRPPCWTRLYVQGTPLHTYTVVSDVAATANIICAYFKQLSLFLPEQRRLKGGTARWSLPFQPCEVSSSARRARLLC